MLEDFEAAFERIEAWWNCDAVDRACIAFVTASEEPAPEMDPSSFWPSADEEPDLEGLVDYCAACAGSQRRFGEALPTIRHAWGGRGTPMTIAAYMGGRVKLRETTVWVEPVVEDWRSAPVRFDPENVWWKRSRRFFELAADAAEGRFIPVLPDYGDCLTVFSLLRGAERLLFDIIDDREAVIEARDKFLKAWPEYHRTNWEVYRRRFPGDCSWLVWAPGRTYALQCDFSVMLTPRLFEELVVPEIEEMGKYLEYIVWHLDGPEEIKYLDILLELPQIRAVQWVPGAGKPTASHWIPMLRRVQEKKRALYLKARDEEEVEAILNELSPEGLFLSGGFTGKTSEDAEELLREVTRLSAKRR